jgi:hypothetical protein
MELVYIRQKCDFSYTFNVLFPHSEIQIIRAMENNSYKVVPVHATRAHGGNRGIPPLLLNLGDRWRWVVNVTPRPLYPDIHSAGSCLGSIADGYDL